jgi:hypothetical protein
VRCCVSRALTPLLAIDPGRGVSWARTARCRGPLLSLVALAAGVLGCGGGATSPTAPAPPLPADLRAHSAATSAAGRAAIVAAAQRAITTDARGRARRHEFRGPVLRTSCKPRGRPGEPTRGDIVVYSCIAISFVGPRLVDSPPLISGQPFQVRIDFAARRFTWCKYQPPGGEGTGRPGEERQPPKACGGV